MPSYSRSLTAVLSVGVALVLVAGAAVAANVETIYLGGMKVMTLRDQGSYASLTARAVAVDKAITEVLSTQDSQHPVVTVKQLKGLWTVYCGSIAVVSVYPADAAPNRMDPKTQALSWSKTLAQALPRATPCSLLPASSFQPAAAGGTPVKPAPVKPAPVTPVPVKPVPVTPSEDATPGAAAVTPAPVAPAPTAPTPAPVIPASVGVSAPVLIVQDVFATVRALPEDEYSSQRADLVTHLLSDLTPFITGKVPATTGAPAGIVPVAPAGGVTGPVAPTAVKPVAPVKPAPVKPTAVKPVAPVKPAPVKPTAVKPAPAKPTATKPAPVKPVAPKPAPVKPAPAVTAPAVPADNPAYARVPQKMRIREKLEQSREPFLALRQANPELAAQVGDLLASCRNSFALGKFDESEGFVDAALRLMGPQ